MRKRMILSFLVFAIIASWGIANDLVPVAVSPSVADGVAVVRQICPTFSWTSDEVAKKSLQEMMGGYAGNIAASFDLTGGSQSGVQGSEGTYNTSYGYYAGGSLTTGKYNSFFGRSSGYATTVGSKNTFMGYAAGRYNISSDNTFVGYTAGYKNTTGNQNTFIGCLSGYNSTVGHYNTFLGNGTGYKNTIGSENTFLGYNAGYNIDNGSSNVFVGYQAGYNNSSGWSNTCVGYRAGKNSTGSENIFIGKDTGIDETASGTLHIGNLGSCPLIFGSMTYGYVSFNGHVCIDGGDNQMPTHILDVGQSGAFCDGGAWVAGSSREYKENIETLTSDEALQAFEELVPVKFNYKENKEEQYLGFIAEDVPGLVAMKDRKGLNPMDIVAMLTKVVQEQQKTLSELKEIIKKLENRSQK